MPARMQERQPVRIFYARNFLPMFLFLLRLNLISRFFAFSTYAIVICSSPFIFSFYKHLYICPTQKRLECSHLSFFLLNFWELLPKILFTFKSLHSPNHFLMCLLRTVPRSQSLLFTNRFTRKWIYKNIVHSIQQSTGRVMEIHSQKLH